MPFLDERTQKFCGEGAKPSLLAPLPLVRQPENKYTLRNVVYPVAKIVCVQFNFSLETVPSEAVSGNICTWLYMGLYSCLGFRC